MLYNLHERVAEFKRVYDERGEIVLLAFNNINCFKCYYGDETNPDEYLGYAQRFMEQYRNLKLDHYHLVSLEFFEEMVRRSFYIGQVISDPNYASSLFKDEVLEAIPNIAGLIFTNFKSLAERLAKERR